MSDEASVRSLPGDGSLLNLNVAATCPATWSLGPGVRAALWVQGCPFRCPGCIAPAWIPFQTARLASPVELVAELLRDSRVTGLTFSGGEPMLQAAGLAEVIRLARQERDLSLICFTGFRLERLRRRPPAPGVDRLLAAVDVLIDGPYVAALNNGRGLRGSANQQIHFLTNRLRDIDYDFAGRPRQAEVRLSAGETFVVGVPPSGLLSAITLAERQSTERWTQAGPGGPS